VIGVLCGLFVIGLIILAFWLFRRRRQRRQRRQREKDEAVQGGGGTERLTSMYGDGQISPIPGPRSLSPGVETSTGAQTMQESIQTSVSPGSVESGGGILHEMHGMPPPSFSISRRKQYTSSMCDANPKRFLAHRTPDPVQCLLFQ
jgi:hypothetical protein